MFEQIDFLGECQNCSSVFEIDDNEFSLCSPHFFACIQLFSNLGPLPVRSLSSLKLTSASAQRMFDFFSQRKCSLCQNLTERVLIKASVREEGVVSIWLF